MRVTPAGFSTSTRVVISNVRQSLAAGLEANIRSGFGNANVAEAIPAVRKNSRRLMAWLRQTCKTSLRFFLRLGTPAPRIAFGCGSRQLRMPITQDHKHREGSCL